MKNLQEPSNKEAIGEAKENKLKKYNVHGKITTGKEPGTTEISYYECDETLCTKKIIK